MTTFESWHLGDGAAIYTASSVYVKRCETREEAEEEIARHNAREPKTASAAPDMVNHPPHYPTLPCGVEPIDVIEHLPHNRGAAVKYLLRTGLKGGPEQEVEDLRKAAFYCTREADRIEKAQASS